MDIKSQIPYPIKVLRIRIISKLKILILSVFAVSKLSASLYYFIFNSSFRNEHFMVLKGRIAFIKNQKKIIRTSAQLRRNIHRIEKGLVMKPRKKVFAEKFINETVTLLHIASISNDFNNEELKWGVDVLETYYNTVQFTPLIERSFKKFKKISFKNYSSEKYVPIPVNEIPKITIDIANFDQLVKNRKSVRWYNSKKVKPSIIQTAVAHAALAPSACNRLPYSFYITSNQEESIQLAKLAGGTSGWVDNIQNLCVVIGDLSYYPNENDNHTIYIDASLASMQFILSLQNQGIASCVINWPNISEAEKRMSEELKLEPYQKPIILIAFGYADENESVPFSMKKPNQVLIHNK